MKNIVKICLIIILVIILGLGTYIYFFANQYVEFSTSSQVKGKELKVTDYYKLFEYLEKFKLRKGVKLPIISNLSDQQASFVSVDKIDVIYTNVPQNYMHIITENGVVESSYGQQYDQNSKTLNLYIHVDTVKSNEIGDTSMIVETITLQALFELSHFSTYPQYLRQTKMGEFVREYFDAEGIRPAFLKVANSKKAFSIVGIARAQSCNGTYECGNYSCTCTSTGLSCSGAGSVC
ncbi:MAG: hypothetical protein ACYDGL_03300 [Bellilinea sp.]